jgi:NAD(P)-dependent dehydrogenase (short-subunit alcohol dehydrogenase family)
MPGLVMGETQERQDHQASQEMFVQAARTTCLGRPADLAGISAFLLSDEAEWVNGQVWYGGGGGAHLRQRDGSTASSSHDGTERPDRT